MKVWEKCNEVKGTNATIDEIARWAYDNRICPLDFDVALDIDLPLDGVLMSVNRKNKQIGLVRKWLNNKLIKMCRGSLMEKSY